MDFAFMRSSTEDYRRPNKDTDHVVTSYDGYSSHLVIVDGASRRVWVFLTKTKDPPIEILRAFMTRFASHTGLVRTDQGGELARSGAVRTMMLTEFRYVVEPTGANSPSQNGGAEIYNNTLTVKVRTLLMVQGFPLNSGRRLSYTRYIYTINSFIRRSTKRHTRRGAAESPTFLTYVCLVHASVSNERAHAQASSIGTIYWYFHRLHRN